MSCGRLISSLISQKRTICTTSTLSGKRNFRKFLLYNKRGTRSVKESQLSMQNPPVPVHNRGVRPTGMIVNGEYVEVTEKIPELIVPSFDDCNLRPYVSYKSPDVTQSEFTSLDLFNAVYANKIVEDFKQNKLKGCGAACEPSENEKMCADEALIKARKTGSDIF